MTKHVRLYWPSLSTDTSRVIETKGSLLLLSPLVIAPVLELVDWHKPQSPYDRHQGWAYSNVTLTAWPNFVRDAMSCFLAGRGGEKVIQL